MRARRAGAGEPQGEPRKLNAVFSICKEGQMTFEQLWPLLNFGKCESEHAAARIALLCRGRDGRFDWKRPLRISDMSKDDPDFERDGFVHLIVGGFLNPVEVEIDRSRVEYIWDTDIGRFPALWATLTFTPSEEFVRRVEAGVARLTS